MRRALELAEKGRGFTSPNPTVGAVIVKGGAIIAEGYHRRAGEDHAEIVAMRALMAKSGIRSVDIDPALFRNAELYVTLEPCAHQGKTPACARTIAAVGFRKVYIGMRDPFAKVNGRGIQILQKAGIEVELVRSGTVLAAEIRALNQPFIKWAKTGLPYVTLKAGMSLDGKIATCAGDSQWITGEKARKDAYMERSLCDAVIVGAGTVAADDPELAVKGKYSAKRLLRVVVDGKLSLGLQHKVFRNEDVLVACCDGASLKNRKKFKSAGVEVKSFGRSEVSFEKLLKYLGGRGVQSVFVEGGSKLNGTLFDQSLKRRELLDRVLFYIAPSLIGGSSSLPVIGGSGVEKVARMIDFDEEQFELCGRDLKFNGLTHLW